MVDAFGDHHGSMPSERIQNRVHQNHASLYNAVVGRLYGRRWHRFVEEGCAHVATLVPTVRSAGNGETIWRIHLNRDRHRWEDVDRQQGCDAEPDRERVVDLLLKLCPAVGSRLERRTFAYLRRHALLRGELLQEGLDLEALRWWHIVALVSAAEPGPEAAITAFALDDSTDGIVRVA